MRHCCLCRKQCGTNIEAAHIIDEGAGGTNEEENGIPACFDCHQEIGAYRDSHPKGNKFRPEELRARRDKVYELVAAGKMPLPAVNEMFLEHVEIRGGEGSAGPGGDAKAKGALGQSVRMIGGSIVGGRGGEDGGKGGECQLGGRGRSVNVDCRGFRVACLPRDHG
jgi:hypothetical protein